MAFKARPTSTLLGALIQAPAARAALITLTWGQELEEAEDAVESAGYTKDPWVAQFLRAVMLRPELPEVLKVKALTALAQMGK